MAKSIAIGSDHGGYKLKEKLKAVLKKSGYKVIDSGTYSEEPCDYPEYGFETARKVSVGEAARGIVICKSGIGMSIIANKLPGVRAGLCGSVRDAESSREHNDANVLVLASAKLSPAKAIAITEAWLSTKALGTRHSRRVRQIKEMEKKVFKSPRSHFRTRFYCGWLQNPLAAFSLSLITEQVLK